MTSGTARRVSFRLRDAIRGRATATTPTARAGMSAQMIGNAWLTRAVAKRLAPKHTAAPLARSDARSGSPEPPPGVMLARTTPAAITPSIAAEPSPRVSPVATASNAAIAPSVELIGATIDTLPTRSPAYESSRPATFPIPETSIQAVSRAPRLAGTPCSTVHGAVITKPTSITHASTDRVPISRVERDAQSIPVAQKAAAPSPPRIAITAYSYSRRRSRRVARRRLTPRRGRSGSALARVSSSSCGSRGTAAAGPASAA